MNKPRGHVVREVLHSYASGDGAISFVWVDENAPHGGEATARKVLLEEAQELVKQEQAKGYFKGDWDLIKINGFWELVKRVTRTGNNTLVMDGRKFRYYIDEDNVLYQMHKELTTHNLHVFTYSEKGKEDIEVKNLSMHGEIKFFLMHEQEIMEARE